MRLVLAIITLFGLTGMAQAEGALAPVVPVATGDPHAEGNEYWRKHHMELMRHGRNQTLREGERDIDASLAQCFDCHTVEEAGEPVTYESDKHFCRSCHDYAAVSIDCFKCHRSTPSDNILNRAMATPEEPNSIAAYLERLAAEASE
ncbi:MAG: hypothetical protein GY945_02390 [Rhodobacteraceae bacterium]|nr:hypothetical protein [Paracoccaceae bacterium]